MDQKTESLYLSAPFENNDLEKRLEKNLSDVDSFNISINNIKRNVYIFQR